MRATVSFFKPILADVDFKSMLGCDVKFMLAYTGLSLEHVLSTYGE